MNPQPPISQAEPWRLLVLCTGNSARSIMAEALINHLCGGHIQAVSAGSQPTGKVHPFALQQIANMGWPLASYHSKSWTQFTSADAPRIDVVLSVCASAAAEVCPVFPGDAIRVGWPLPDPAAVSQKNLQQAAFQALFAQLHRRIDRLSVVTQSPLDKATLVKALQQLDAMR